MTKIAILVPDLHCPYHDVKATNAMFSVIEDLQKSIGRPVDELCILGDLADAFGFGLHPKLPDMASVKETIKDEIYQCHKLLDRFDSLGAKKKVYIEGNHEQRAQRYMMKNCPELFEEGYLRDKLKIDERGYDWVKFSRGNKGGTGQLHRILDCELYARHRPYSGGKNIAHANMDKKHISLVNGDTHRVQRVIRKRGDGKYIECLSLGCLIDFNSEVFSYMDTDDWAQGFGIVYQFSDDPHDYIIDFINIKNGRAVYGNKIHEG
jgi:hypothetical protein